MLRCLIRQLCAASSKLPVPLIDLYMSCREKGFSPTLGELTTALQYILEDSTKDTYIIVDALDEFPMSSKSANRKEMLDVLTRMADNSLSTVHVLVTSREEPDIKEAIRQIPHQAICLEQARVDDDIRIYVRSCLEDPTTRLHKLEEKLKNDIEDTLGKGAHGM